MWTAAAQPPTPLTSRALRRDELIVMEEMHTLYLSLENKSYEQADTFVGRQGMWTAAARQRTPLTSPAMTQEWLK